MFVIERRFRPRPPGLFAAYVTLYCAGRFSVEQLRVDPANEILGMRLNGWVSLVGIVAGASPAFSSGSGGRRNRRGAKLPWKRSAPKPPPQMAVPQARGDASDPAG